ncbi:uncharacterized protein LOC106529336 [Austrofundulus limnaeus]|uniref:Uncharacterized protein LOC106529336 n=1 Tax=Austrofundulus limnaeus TaxID=52670 RepID=A0A2I4CJM0_AUSLI|nr:PREDICTED: uncharacterized protein LOC106529336 [Austrofundulus limnaeus]
MSLRNWMFTSQRRLLQSKEKPSFSNSLTEKFPQINIMDVTKELDVYIPKEAEVCVIPLNRLPNSVLKKMGLPLPDRESADSPDVVWICPAIMKRKGPGPASRRESCSLEKLQVVSTTLQMSFISSNLTAWELLQTVTSGAQLSRAGLLRQDSVPPGNQNGLVIDQDRIYLCIRRSARTRGQPRPRKLQPTQPAGPSASTSPEQDPGSERRHQILQAAGKPLKRKAESPVSAASPPRQLLVLDGGEQNVEDEDGAGGSWSSAGGSGRNSPEQSWAVRQTLAAASASSSLSREFDFKELENEEKLAQKKAKFLQDVAALEDLQF